MKIIFNTTQGKGQKLLAVALINTPQ